MGKVMSLEWLERRTSASHRIRIALIRLNSCWLTKVRTWKPIDFQASLALHLRMIARTFRCPPSCNRLRTRIQWTRFSAFISPNIRVENSFWVDTTLIDMQFRVPQRAISFGVKFHLMKRHGLLASMVLSSRKVGKLQPNLRRSCWTQV